MASLKRSTMEGKTCKKGWGTIGEEGPLNRFPRNVTVMCSFRAQRYYRCGSGTTATVYRAVPSAVPFPAAAVELRELPLLPVSGTTAGAAGTTAGPLRISSKGSSGTTE